MAAQVINPNKKSHSFTIALAVVIIIAAVVIGYVFTTNKSTKTANIDVAAAEEVSMEVSFADNMITLKAANATAETPQVDIYEDFSCHYCAQLAEQTDAQMKEKIEAGQVIVNIHTLAFLDQGRNGFSHAAGQAELYLAQAGEAKAYWNLRAAIFKDQSNVYSKWGNKELADAAQKFGASEDVVAQIQKDDDHNQLGEVADANADKLKGIIGEVSSPHVIYQGKSVQNTYDWIPEVLGS